MDAQTQLDLERREAKLRHDQEVQDKETLAIEEEKIKADELAALNAPATLTFKISEGSYFMRRKPRASNTLHKHSVELKLSTLSEALNRWYGINPRVPTTKNSLAKRGFEKTAATDVGWMDVVSGGIKMSVKSVTINDVGDEITINMDDRSLHGIIDGGHSLHFALKILSEKIDSGESLEDWDAYIEVDFYTGIMLKTEISKMIDGHGTRNPVNPYLITNASGAYDALKENLKEAWFFNDVAWKGEGKLKLQELARIVSILDMNKFPNKSDNPVRIDFESKTGADEDNINDTLSYQHSMGFQPEGPIKNGNFKKYNNSMKILFDNALNILELRDRIDIMLFDDFRLNMVNVFTMLRNKRESILTDSKGRELKFLRTSTGKPIHVQSKKCDMWTYTILGAMRANIKWDSKAGNMEWIIDPETVLKAVMPDLIVKLAAAHKKGGHKANSLRENSTIHPQVYGIVAKYVKANKP